MPRSGQRLQIAVFLTAARLQGRQDWCPPGPRRDRLDSVGPQLGKAVKLPNSGFWPLWPKCATPWHGVRAANSPRCDPLTPSWQRPLTATDRAAGGAAAATRFFRPRTVAEMSSARA